jgi:hypothetical protein
MLRHTEETGKTGGPEEPRSMAEAAMKLSRRARVDRAEESAITLLDLVAALAEVAESDDEILAAVSELINSGRVRLIGNFRGADVLVR